MDSHLASCAYESLKGFFALHDLQVASLKAENVRLQQRVSALEGLVHILQRESVATTTALGPWHRPHFTGPAPSSQQISSAPPLREPETSEGYPFPTISSAANGLPRLPNGTEMDQMFASLSADAPVQPGSSAELLSSPAIATHGHSTPSQSHSQPTFTVSFSAPIAPLDLSTTLENTLHGLRSSIVGVSSALSSMGRHVTIAQSADTARTAEELGALRSVINGLRMQVCWSL
jgi:hypothetical protein